MLLQIRLFLLGALGFFENGKNVVWEIQCARVPFNCREPWPTDCASASMILHDGELKLCIGFELQRLGQLIDCPCRFAEGGVDGPAGFKVTIDASSYIPTVLTEGSRNARKLHRLSVCLNDEFIDNEIRVAGRCEIAAWPVLFHGGISQGFQADGRDFCEVRFGGDGVSALVGVFAGKEHTAILLRLMCGVAGGTEILH